MWWAIAIALGLASGVLGAFLEHRRRPGNVVATVVLATVGALLGAWLARMVQVGQTSNAFGFVVAAVGGAVLLLGAQRMIFEHPAMP